MTIIIPCYFMDESYVDMTIKCVESLEFGRPPEVIVVDDGSPVNATIPDVDQIIRLRPNRGYAVAVNAGLAAAHGEVLIIANNDTTFNPGWLEAILVPLNNGYDISSIRTSDCDGYLTEDKITEGDKFGSLWAMKRKVYNELGGIDEGYGKGYFEDLDYRRRALNAGFRIAKNHAGLVEHLGRTTFSKAHPGDGLYEQSKRTYIKKWGRLE